MYGNGQFYNKDDTVSKRKNRRKNAYKSHHVSNTSLTFLRKTCGEGEAEVIAALGKGLSSGKTGGKNSTFPPIMNLRLLSYLFRNLS
jgi:hypothetical protein